MAPPTHRAGGHFRECDLLHGGGSGHVGLSLVRGDLRGGRGDLCLGGDGSRRDLGGRRDLRLDRDRLGRDRRAGRRDLCLGGDGLRRGGATGAATSAGAATWASTATGSAATCVSTATGSAGTSAGAATSVATVPAGAASNGTGAAWAVVASAVGATCTLSPEAGCVVAVAVVALAVVALLLVPATVARLPGIVEPPDR